MSYFRVNTPLASANSLRLFSQSQAKMETAIQRLSSGLRINSAKDDSAGQAISQRMKGQVLGKKMAGQNIKLGMDLIQTAEGGMSEIQSILNRMRELSVQSASDGLNTTNRASINLEFNQLKAEITRISNSTEYNGMKLLRGGQSSEITGQQSINNTEDLVIGYYDLTAGVGTDNQLPPIQNLNSTSKQLSTLSSQELEEIQILFVQNPSNSSSYASEWIESVESVKTYIENGGILVFHDRAINEATTQTIVPGAEDVNFQRDLQDDVNTPISGLDTFLSSSNRIITDQNLDGLNSSTHGYAIPDFPSGTEILLHAGTENQNAVTFSYPVQKGYVIYSAVPLDFALSGSGGSVGENFRDIYAPNILAYASTKVGSPESSSQQFNFQIDTNNTAKNQLSVSIECVTVESLSLSDKNLTKLGDAQSTINSLDAAINFINDQRSNLGAVTNRLEFAHSSVYSGIQNTEASLSTIKDADFAVEAANLVKSQILTQAGSTMLAQANNLSQNILSLIQ